MVELLVVIAIIGVLVSILIPVIGKVRLSANTTATQNELVQISSAIQNYQNDFQAYPGATPSSLFYSDPTSQMLDKNLTSTEDLVLALMGGTDFNLTTGVYSFNDQMMGKGPISRNKLTPGQKNAYMDIRPGMLSPISKMMKTPPDLKFLKDGGAWLSYVVSDSDIPEFVDTYSDFRAILYVPANPGAKRKSLSTIPQLANFGASYDPTAYYNMKSVQAYIRPFDANLDSATEQNKKNDVFQFPVRGADQTAVNNYFKIDPIGGATDYSARGAGSYILISAGPDRRFGTPDDIIVVGGGGQ